MTRGKAIDLSKELKAASGGKRSMCMASKSEKYGWGVSIVEPDGSSSFYYEVAEVHAEIKKFKEAE